MLPNKAIKISKSKIYKALAYYDKYSSDSMFLDVNVKELRSYSEIEYLTILYAIGYIKRDGDYILKKVFF